MHFKLIKIVEFFIFYQKPIFSSQKQHNLIRALIYFVQFFYHLNFCLQYFFYNLCNTFPLIIIVRQYFLTTNFIVFGFIILFDLNSNPSNLVENLFIRVFLVDCIMCLNISLTVLKISNSSLSGLILIDLQSNFCSIAFCRFLSKSIFLSLRQLSSIFIASLQSEKHKSILLLKNYIVFVYFLLQIN